MLNAKSTRAKILTCNCVIKASWEKLTLLLGIRWCLTGSIHVIGVRKTFI